MYSNQLQNPYQLPQYGGTIPAKCEIVHVQGENGARSMRMQPNSSALAWDDTAPIIWLCQTDGAGFLTATPLDVTPHKVETSEDLKTLQNRIDRIEAVLYGKQSNAEPAQSDPTENKQSLANAN